MRSVSGDVKIPSMLKTKRNSLLKRLGRKLFDFDELRDDIRSKLMSGDEASKHMNELTHDENLYAHVSPQV